MLVGYARVSSAGQSLEVQREQLRAAGCERIFEEKRSGRRATDRPALTEALGFVREGDTLAVTRLDRLARSMLDLHQILAGLTAKGVGFRALQQAGVDTTTSAGKLTLGILGAVAEFEADIRKERQAEGIAKAKAKGLYRGRKATIDGTAIRAALAEGESPSAIAERMKIARSSVYRLCRTPEMNDRD
jgi:DNA invertase Pin-like site-specific DNA recombinase